MIENTVPKPTAGDWSDALLMSDTEALLGAVRNYVGSVKTPYDKHDLVSKLEAFLRRTETRESLLALLDFLDLKILGSSILLGPVPEQALKDLFVGEIPLFDLGVRIANLLDRLLLFRYQVGGRRYIAINPLFEKEISRRALDFSLILDARPAPSGPAPGNPRCVGDAQAAVALFSFLFHTPFAVRKGGGLTKRATERFASLYPELASGGEGAADKPGALALALSLAGAFPSEDEEDRYPDRDSFARILSEWGEDLPYFLAACLAIDAVEGQAPDGEGPRAAPKESARHLATVLAGALEALPPALELPRPALVRWLRLAARKARFASDPGPALESLESLGLIAAGAEGILVAAPVAAAPAAPRSGVLVAEGSHALHLMPEAGLEDRLFVGCVARPVAFGKVWSFEVDRDTVRRAFAAGLSASEVRSRLEALAGMGLPQSFTFSLTAWEEEYRSLRIYRGYTLVVDERQRPVIERSKALGSLVAETLAPGVYFLSAASADEAVGALAAAGLEVPPLVQPAGRPPRREPAPAEGEGSRLLPRGGGPGLARRRIDALRELIGPAPLGAAPSGTPSPAAPSGTPAGSPSPDPGPRLAELRACLAASARGEEERRELADRIERRLVLTERQIAQSDPRPERLEAGGLDYLGKVRVVERALRSSGDRLEVLYRLPGEEPVRALLRPVKLEKNDKGLVLEAEDLGTGSPVRVSLGAVSTVRRLRASLFGETQ